MPPSSASHPVYLDEEALPAGAPKPFLLKLAPLVLVLYALPNLAWGVLMFLNQGAGTGSSPGGGLSGDPGVSLAWLALIAAGGVPLAAAWGFWADRLWARPLLLVYGAIMTLASFLIGARMEGPVGAVSYAWMPGLVTAFLWSYLYGSSSPAAYYARLEAASTDP